MSRSGYSEDFDFSEWSSICWRGAVESAIRGQRGQAFLKDLLAALDAMPVKRLIAEELTHDGEVCAIGSLGAVRGIDMGKLDPEEPTQVAQAFGIATALAQEVVYMNDEAGDFKETPEQRYARMRAWVANQIPPDEATA